MKNKTKRIMNNKKPSKKSTIHSIPVGVQVIKIPKNIASLIKQQKDNPKILVTRVWIRQAKGKFFLHVGDVESKHHT